MNLLTVMAGGPNVTCVITIAVEVSPGLRAFTSMFTVVWQASKWKSSKNKIKNKLVNILVNKNASSNYIYIYKNINEIVKIL